MPTRRDRRPLNRERILRAAMALADEGGLESLSMRQLGQALDVEGMALYRHVSGKDEIIDGIVDLVLEEIPDPGATDWRDAMRARAVAARTAFMRHPWAIGLLEARHENSSPTRLSYYDATLGCLRAAGFSPGLSMSVFSMIDSYVYGFILQEISLPFDDDESLEDVGEDLLRQMADAYPHLTEATREALSAGWDYDEQFAFGLDLVLDAVDGLRPPG